MKKIVIIILSALALLSCDNDNNTDLGNLDSSYLFGEWLLYDKQNLNGAVEMTLTDDFKVHNITYLYPLVYSQNWKNEYGTWKYSNATNHFTTTMIMEDASIYEFVYDIIEVDEYKLKVLYAPFHSVDTYHRIIHTYNRYMNDKIEIDCIPDNFHVDEFKSLNESIASISNDNKIVTHGIGTTFIIAKSGDNLNYSRT